MDIFINGKKFYCKHIDGCKILLFLKDKEDVDFFKDWECKTFLKPISKIEHIKTFDYVDGYYHGKLINCYPMNSGQKTVELAYDHFTKSLAFDKTANKIQKVSEGREYLFVGLDINDPYTLAKMFGTWLNLYFDSHNPDDDTWLDSNCYCYTTDDLLEEFIEEYSSK
jgi:hypothetical protein